VAGQGTGRGPEGLLHTVFGVAFIAGHPVRQTEQIAAMALDKQTECIGVAAAHPFDNNLVAQGHFLGCFHHLAVL
jgi:hypothetical protein